MWRQNLLKCTFALGATLAAVAGPLDKTKIASDAKWLVHIDVDALRNTALGRFLIRDLVKPALEDADELKDANLSMNISNITSVTAYGPAFEKGADGVLMIATSANPKKDLDTVAGMFLLSAGTNAPFTLVEQNPYPLYTFAKSVYLAPTEHALFVAKSKEQIERANNVVRGKAENLAASSSFKEFKPLPNTFLSVAVAEGFSGTQPIPAQAQILREAAGGRLCIGERDENVFLNLAFQGRDEMATTRIQQVLQGIVALASLSQQDPDITQLAGGTKITAQGQNVLVNVEFPVEKTIEKIKEGAHDDHRAHGGRKGKAKKKKAGPTHAEDTGAADAEPAPGEPVSKKNAE